MKKAIVVAIEVNDLMGRKRDQAAAEALGELNDHLAQGWNVSHSFPMSGTGHTLCSVSVVILEKD